MRRLSADQRRSELLDAAIRVIERDGLEGATVRAIVAEADMPLGAFHYVFESRDELISDLIQKVTDDERLAGWMWAHVNSTAAGPEGLKQLIRVGLEGYFTLLSTNPGQELALFEVAFHAIRNDPSAVTRQWELYREAARQSLVEAAALAGIDWILPMDVLAMRLNQAIDGLTINWLATRDDAAAHDYIGFLAETFSRYAVASESAAALPTEAGTLGERKGQDAHHN